MRHVLFPHAGDVGGRIGIGIFREGSGASLPEVKGSNGGSEMIRSPLSKLELEVARTIWNLQEGTLGAIHKAILAERKMQYATLQTYVRRLEAKGYIESNCIGRTKLYRPKVQLEEVIRDTIDEVRNRLFNGKAVPFVRHLLQDHLISPEELEELKTLFAEIEGRSQG